MYLIFYGNEDGNVFDKLIRWWTSPLSKMFNGDWKTSYSHCELLFSDGMMYSSSQYDNETRYKKHNMNSRSWRRVRLVMSAIEETKIRNFCDSVEGAKYDYLGILGFVLNVGHSQSKWFCSEVCTKALQEACICSELVPHKTSPNKLFKHIRKKQWVY